MDTENHEQNKPETVFDIGRTCCVVAQAERVSFIVDAADYFRALRETLLNSGREVLLIGWDFDFEIEMLPGETDSDGNAPDGFPNRLGPFLDALVEQKPKLNIYMLKWNGAILVAPGRLVPSLAVYAFGNERIHFAFDGHHPFGACHHQKIVVADNTIAFCGGIDVTEDRWDTAEHLPNDPRRTRKNGSISEPWHDATSVVSGPAASALADLARTRWQRATGEVLEAPKELLPIEWPTDLPVNAEQIDVAIARTEPPYDGQPLINEIEELTLASIAAAKETIYVESQYLAAETICDAFKSKLLDPDGPQVIIINPQAALSRLEDDAMHVLRDRMLSDLRECDRFNRFRAYYPVNASDEPIYVHAKIMIVDDQILKIGSSNLNDRSMGFDTECDVAIEGHADVISQFRNRLLSEHLGVQSTAFAHASGASGSLIDTIEKLNAKSGRRLCEIDQSRDGKLGQVLADTRILDPRYEPGHDDSVGQGLRPRHLSAAIGIGLCSYMAWLVFAHLL